MRSALAFLEGRARWIAPLLIAALALPFAVISLWVLTYATLGRDQGIFQYVAWALRHGERAYLDFHDINGPLPHAWHSLLQLFGGADEHVFRSIHTWILVIAYLVFSSGIPGWVGLEVKRPAKIAWAMAGLAVLGAQYVRFGWWHTTQREDLYSWLVFASLGCQVLAHGDTRRRYWVLTGFFTAFTWFGKPPCAIFAVMQLAVLWFDRRDLGMDWKKALRWSLLGCGISSAIMIAFLVVFADFHAMFEMLVAVPRLHHTIWNKTLIDCYREYGNAPRIDWMFVSIGAFLVSYRLFKLPKRALLALILPIGGFIVFLAQRKGFPYHLHMAMLGTGIVQLVVVAAAARSGRWGALLSIGLALGLGYKSMDDAGNSEYMRSNWATGGATPEMRQSRQYFDSFPWGDFFPGDLRDAAAYLKRTTKPDDRVQVYGMEPYLLFLAERRSGTPILYSFELDVDPALEGGTGARPTEDDEVWLRSYRDAAEQAMLAQMKTRPPAAFVFMDDSPFAHAPNGEQSFAEHCPETYAWITVHYAPSVIFGKVRIRERR